jgi:hypothetical protein
MRYKRAVGHVGIGDGDWDHSVTGKNFTKTDQFTAIL